MKFAASKVPIITSLDRLSRIVKSNPRSVEILQCVLVEAIGQEVYITATSSMASARVQVTGAKVAESGKFVVGLDRLKDRVSKAAEALVLETSANSLRILSSDDQKLGLSLNDTREFPEIDWTDPEESYGLKKKEVVELFKVANSLTSTTSSLTPAFLQVHIKEQNLWVASGVSYQVFPMECNPSLNSSIPTQTLSALTAFIQEAEGDTVWLSQLNEDDVVVSVGQDQFQTTPLAVDFPDLTPLFDKVRVASVSECIVKRRRLVEELSKAKTSVDNYGRISIKIEGVAAAMMVLQASSHAGDWYESKIPVIWTGTPDRTFTFNLEALLKFLRTFSGDDITLFIGDDFKGDLAPIYAEEEGHEGIINQFRI